MAAIIMFNAELPADFTYMQRTTAQGMLHVELRRLAKGKRQHLKVSDCKALVERMLVLTKTKMPKNKESRLYRAFYYPNKLFANIFKVKNEIPLVTLT